MNNQNNQVNKSGFNNGDFIKGALIGAALTFLLTNKDAQKNIMKAASKGSELFQVGMEELKERYEDARAAMEANQQ
jgi:gas vesicle protein